MNLESIVLSGYVRCKDCEKQGVAIQMKGGCIDCTRRNFEYGVMHKNRFMNYGDLHKCVVKGQTFIDASNAGLRITQKTFQIAHGQPKRHFK